VLWSALRIVGAIFVAVTIYVMGAALIRKFKIVPPEVPDPGELRVVDVEYRCTVCGATVTMTAAPGDDPEPPRHCREDMVPVTESA
jgi:hypothetical protein